MVTGKASGRSSSGGKAAKAQGGGMVSKAQGGGKAGKAGKKAPAKKPEGKSMTALADELGVTPQAVSRMKNEGKIGWNGLKGSRCRVWLLEEGGGKKAKKKKEPSPKSSGRKLEELEPAEVAQLLRLEKLRNMTADTELKKTRGRSFFLEMRMQMAEMVYEIFSRTFLREIREQLSTLRLSREETDTWNLAMERGAGLFGDELREWAESVIKQTVAGTDGEE